MVSMGPKLLVEAFCVETLVLSMGVFAIEGLYPVLLAARRL